MCVCVGGWDDLKAGNPEGEKGEIRRAQTVFPVAQIKKRGRGGGERKREEGMSRLRSEAGACVANPLL